MTRPGELGPPPEVAIEIEDDASATARCDEGFLRLRRLTLRHRAAGGATSAPYRYDVIDRRALDAVALVLVEAAGPRVCLRSAIRPPLGLRGDGTSAAQWEIPAGLIEPDETVDACAARETHEETGLRVAAAAFAPLGPPVALAPGVLGERLHFRLAFVRADEAEPPPSDGHPVEGDAEIHFVTLDDAFAAVRAGRLGDVKTELALYRLERHLAAGGGPP